MNAEQIVRLEKVYRVVALVQFVAAMGCMAVAAYLEEKYGAWWGVIPMSLCFFFMIRYGANTTKARLITKAKDMAITRIIKEG